VDSFFHGLNVYSAERERKDSGFAQIPNPRMRFAFFNNLTCIKSTGWPSITKTST
jgi:hypothetical protein